MLWSLILPGENLKVTQSLKMFCANRPGASLLGNLAGLEQAPDEECGTPFS